MLNEVAVDALKKNNRLKNKRFQKDNSKLFDVSRKTGFVLTEQSKLSPR